MGIYSLFIKFAVISGFSFFIQQAAMALSPSQENLNIQTSQVSFAATLLKCKAGYKPGKTAISLVAGDKVACVDPKSAALGKKLLTSVGNSCFACHAVGGMSPATHMSANLQAQGFTLKPVSILSAFQQHSAVMAGLTLTAKDAKNISQYLQTLKLLK